MNMNQIKTGPTRREVETPVHRKRSPETPAEPPACEFTGPQAFFRGIRFNSIAGLFAFTVAGSMSAQTTVPSTAPQQTTREQNQGWMMYDDRAGTALGPRNDQRHQLRDVDGRYQERYTGLGRTPWTNDGYNTLSESRERDYRGILTPTQCYQWHRTHGSGRPGHPKPTMQQDRNMPVAPNKSKMNP